MRFQNLHSNSGQKKSHMLYELNMFKNVAKTHTRVVLFSVIFCLQLAASFWWINVLNKFGMEYIAPVMCNDLLDV